MIKKKVRIKKFLYVFLCIFFIFFAYFSKPANASKLTKTEDEIFEDQIKKSKADTLIENLPAEAQENLNSSGVSSINWKELVNLNPKKIFLKIMYMIKKVFPGPFKCMFCVVGVILICALLDTLKPSLPGAGFLSTLSAVSSLCISVVVIMPLVSFIGRCAKTIGVSSAFMFSYVPILASIMISSGHAVTAGSYQVLMLSVSEIVSQVSSKLFVPVVSSFLAISFISAISNRINVSGICKFFYKFVKWGLSLSMTVFVSLLTLQSLVGSSVDNVGSKATRFMISSFIPIVGGALSDAFSTVQSSLKLLKSSVGAIGIVAAEFIFLPIILEAILWILMIYFCSAISDIFSLTKISELLNNATKAISMILSIIISCLILLTVSSVIVLTITNTIS